MVRLSLFILFVIGVVLVLNFKQHRSLPLDNRPFDFEQAEAEHLLRKKLIAELGAASSPAENDPSPQKKRVPWWS